MGDNGTYLEEKRSVVEKHINIDVFYETNCWFQADISFLDLLMYLTWYYINESVSQAKERWLRVPMLRWKQNQIDKFLVSIEKRDSLYYSKNVNVTFDI